jgi:hypothetical protein
MFGADSRPRAPSCYKHHLLPFPPAKPDPVSGTRPPRWFAHHVFVADHVEVCWRPASGRQQAGPMMRARESCVPVSPAAPHTAASMTDKMLLHPGDPLPALTEIDVTVIALPADDHATTQELIASHGPRFPAGHGAGASGIAGAPAPS